jgi:uncharacterized membrane protein YcaP (DUF421 family)
LPFAFLFPCLCFLHAQPFTSSHAVEKDGKLAVDKKRQFSFNKDKQHTVNKDRQIALNQDKQLTVNRNRQLTVNKEWVRHCQLEYDKSSGITSQIFQPSDLFGAF